MKRALAVVILVGCGSDPQLPPDPPIEHPYEPVPAEPQRPGDAAKGYDYLINGDYITCGLPKSLYDSVFGPAPVEDRLAGRTGESATLPYYYGVATAPSGVKVVSGNCLTCHAGHIDGKLVVGLGVTDRDFTINQATQVGAVGDLVTDPAEHAEWSRFNDRMQAIGPYTQMLTIGPNPADNLTAALMAHRDPTTLAWSNEPLLELPPAIVAPVDVPPWWRMAKKSAMFYSASGRGDHARIMMAASLLCSDTVAEAAEIDAAFVDVRAWISSLEAPKWPHAIDAALAERGKPIFESTCATCHGTYGEDASYPNQLVPLEDVGTDPVLASGASQFSARYVQWFNDSFWGETSRMEMFEGYIAPPLDGIWATAPYFHNGSVPTIAAVLDPAQRPQFWTRTFDSTDYDKAALGWKFTVTTGQDAEPSSSKRKRIYDTTKPGYGNAGHRFAEELTPDERTALLEYLKTL